MKNPDKRVVPEDAGWKDIPRGGAILFAGNAELYETGDWRTFKPMWDSEKCIHCLRCWIVCPDSSILVEDGKVVGIDYKHCKGCGICEKECPEKVGAIRMVKDSGTEEGGHEDGKQSSTHGQ